MHSNPNCGNHRKEKQMIVITKAMLAAVLVTLGLALAAWAAEPPKPKTEEVWGSVSLLSYYSRQATWQDTMLATREAAARREQELIKAGEPNSPWPGVWLGPWWTIAAAPTADATITDYPFPAPDGMIDTASPHKGAAWEPCAEPKNNKGYLYRVIRAAEPITITVQFVVKDHGTVVWLNGRTVFCLEKFLTFTVDDHNRRLTLAKGDNHLLISIGGRKGTQGNFGLRPVQLWKANPKSGPTPENPLNPLWNRLMADFPDAVSRRQMRWEREDDIWDGPGTEIAAAAMPARYLAAGGRRGVRIAGAANGGMEAARTLYYRACRVQEAQRLSEQYDSLKAAIEDLSATYGERYRRGAEYLAKLNQLREIIEASRAGAVKGDPDAGATFDRAVDACLDLRSEALLANPLLDFERLLLIKRFTSYRGCGGSNGVEPGQPNSFACSAAIPSHVWENEIAVLSPVRPDGKLNTLYRPEDTSFVGDVDLHWDGDRLLFTGVRKPCRFQIFEIGLDGRGLRERVRDQHPDVDNCDACYLPDGGIVFNSTAPMQGVPCTGGSERVANLYRTDADGGSIRRLCFDQEQNYTPSVANDGRILYTRWEYTDTAHVFGRLLFAMRPDGTNQMSVYGSNGYWPTALFSARAIPNHPTKIAAIVDGHHGGRRRGQLVILDPARGQFEADGAVHMIGHKKPPEPIIEDVLYYGVFPMFMHPYPLSEKYLLTAARMTPNSNWAIYLVDVFGNMVLVHEDPEFALTEPIPVRRTPRPPILPPTTRPGATDASILLTDVYQGPGLKGVPRGTVKQLRVYSYVWAHQGMARYGNAGAIDGRRILGAVPVEPDGSAYFRVPANTPLAVQPLDAEGRALQVMRSWYTAMPGEQGSCIGCHERFSDTPPTRTVLAARKPPVDVQPWNGPARPYGFAVEVEPVLQHRCIGCHQGSKANPASAPKLEPGMLRQYLRHVGSESDHRLKQPGEHYAESSELIQMLRKGHHGVVLDPGEFDRLITWIDLNTPIAATWSRPGSRPRRRELDQLYSNLPLDVDVYPVAAPKPESFVKPEPEKFSEAVACANWPFDRAEAERRQKAAAPQTRRRVELGRRADGSPHGELVPFVVEGWEAAGA